MLLLCLIKGEVERKGIALVFLFPGHLILQGLLLRGLIVEKHPDGRGAHRSCSILFLLLLADQTRDG